MEVKKSPEDFALFGGKPLFDSVRSISNLVRPDIEKFFSYSRLFFQDECYSGGRIEERLEARLANFHEVRHCVSFCGGFWGIVFAIKSLALSERTEVVMPSLTYRRLADIVAWAGLVPHFCEVHPQRLCMTVETVRQCINARTALILGVHPIVNCCDAQSLEALSEETGIPLMFDSVESVYETINGRRVGSFGRAECFSMQSSKLLNAFEGGYVTTNDEALAQRLKALRNNGLGIEGRWADCGMNARQNEIHAAMALAALDDVDQQVELNRRRYHRYMTDLATVPGVRLVRFNENERQGYKNIVVELLDDWPISRDLTLALLHRENLLCRPYYYPPLHQKKTGYPMVWEDLSSTDALGKRFLLLPCGYFVSEDDVGLICDFMRALYKQGPALSLLASRTS